MTKSISARRWLLLPVAHKTREFGGRAILALEAIEHGWGVIIGRSRLRRDPRLPRGIVMERSIAPGLRHRMEEAIARGHRLIACCDEGLIYRDAEEYARRKVDLTAFDKVAWFFAWGDNHREDMVAGAGCDPRKIATTGNSRFDLHRPELRGLLYAKAEEIRRRFDPIILVNTKFSKHNGRHTLEEAIVIERSEGVIRTPTDEQFLRDWAAFQGATYFRFMELVGKLSARFPGHSIVVRPHPSENPKPWRDHAEAFSNVEVAVEGNVAEWLLAAEASIHNNCTTGVEAYLLDRRSISYRPVSDPRFDMSLPNALSEEAFDLQGVLDRVDSFLSGQVLPPDDNDAGRAKIARRYIANIDGESASSRTVAVLDQMDAPEEELALTARVAWAELATIRKAGRGLVQRLMGRQSAQIEPNFELVSIQEMHDFVDAAQNATGRFGGVQVVQVSDGILGVYR